jgi:TRAP-type C4-dicarboxylate transport system permease small subunit
MVFLKWMDKVILQALKAMTMACFVALTILVSANVFVRFFRLPGFLRGGGPVDHP